MVTIKELEKERIDKIKSLDSKQLENYVNVIINDICKLHDVTETDEINYDERIAEINDLYSKLDEIENLTNGKFNNIHNYIRSCLNDKISIAENVIIHKYINKDAKTRISLLSYSLRDIMKGYYNFDNYAKLLYNLLNDFNELSADANGKVSAMESEYIETLKTILLSLSEDLKFNIDVLNKMVYPGNQIKNDIAEIKSTIKHLAESDNETDKLLVEFGIIDTFIDLIDIYETHSEISDLSVMWKSEINEIFAADNIFEKYSIGKYDAASGVSFDDFMKNEPKLNINTGELIY